MKTQNLIIAMLAFFGIAFQSAGQTYQMPSENDPHEGTWLQWPHQYEYGAAYCNDLEATWVAMTKALVQGEKVHIIAYKDSVQWRITTLLTNAGVNLANVDFRLFPTNDVWARDNGPIYVRDATGNLVIEDWGFNGWGGKYNFNFDNPIPTEIGSATSTSVVNLNSTMTIEGGAYEIDGKGVFMGCKSAILSQSPANTVRNPGMTQTQAEGILGPYLGISKFIWLNGQTGLDITDMHIDGFAKFANDSTILTMNNADLTYWQVPAADITTLYNATDSHNKSYHYVYVPLTQNNVVTTGGTNLGYQGSYANYYVGNKAVLVPNYNDPNDALANNIIQGLYPGRAVVGIDVRNLYKNGGMVHCVTQQQPVATVTTGVQNQIKINGVFLEQNFPNPFSDFSTLTILLEKEADVQLEIYNSEGRLAGTVVKIHLMQGKQQIRMDGRSLSNGVYNCLLRINGFVEGNRKMVVIH